MRHLSLNGDWTVREKGHESKIPATVPGCIHTDLLRQGLIPDPHYRDNEKQAVQWVTERSWTYERTFEIDAECLVQEQILLRCEGLDTLARIEINDAEVGVANNFHRTWEFDIQSALVEGTNRIRVHFESIIPFITKKDEAERRMPVWKQPGGDHRYQWIRKPAAHFGWDWGPCLMTMGIFREIQIVAFSSARIEDVRVKQTHGDGKVALDIDVHFDGEARIEADLSLDGRHVAGGLAMEIDNPELWWPSGMGAQPLYHLEVTLKDAEGTLLDTWSRRIGLRRLELVCEEDDDGQGMEFRVNGIPFFAKGACWIPADSFLDRVIPEMYAQRLQSAVAANMNMIRVWGGGYFEQDLFYDLCDELGLVVWQDFMFACAGYPAHDEDFLANVKAEAIDNVQRLRHHSCIALWCGNNELELGHELGMNLVGDEAGKMPWKDYSRLFDELLKEVVADYDPQRNYWPSSPHTPVGDRTNASDPRSGNAHFWYVGHWTESPIEYYRTSEHRFVSEFGMQAFPEPRTIHRVTLPEERELTSPMMEYRQRSGPGNRMILDYMRAQFQLPENTEMLLWLSQIHQGICVKYGVEHWRRQMPHCMGTLYWQLNDIWPAPTWASIDCYGRWKALLYMAREFYAPVLVSIVEDSEALGYEVWISSDRLEAGQGELEVVLMTTDGKVVETNSQSVSIPAAGSQLVLKDTASAFVEAQDVCNTLLFFRLTEGGKQLSENFTSFVKPKHLQLHEPGIDTSVCMLGGTTAEMTLSVERPALWLWVECLDDDLELTFSRNFFHLRPGEVCRLQLQLSQAMSPEALGQKLRVQSLYHTCTTEVGGAVPELFSPA
jgi:beta-mannosidase